MSQFCGAQNNAFGNFVLLRQLVNDLTKCQWQQHSLIVKWGLQLDCLQKFLDAATEYIVIGSSIIEKLESNATLPEDISINAYRGSTTWLNKLSE